MKKYGKVTDYNGLAGTIVGVDSRKYVLLDKNLLDKNLNTFDNVEFESEKFNTPEIDIEIARFVKVLKKENRRKF